MALTGIVATTTLADLLGLEVGDIVASGGGGGIESESGSFVVETQNAEFNVLYSKAHEKPANLIWYAKKNADGDINDAKAIMFGIMLDWEGIRTGKTYNQRTQYYGINAAVYMGTSSTPAVQGITTSWFIKSIEDLSGANSKYSMLYYSHTTGITFAVTSTTPRFLVGDEYEWGAYWLPTVGTE